VLNFHYGWKIGERVAIYAEKFFSPTTAIPPSLLIVYCLLVAER
jgi:hypothetical protein